MSVKVKWDPKLARAIIEAQGSAGVRDCANFLLDESRKQVPIDTGALSRSGAIDVNGLKATVSYDTPYAVRQHEGVTYTHQRGRKAKYLEDPCNDPVLKSRMLKYLRDNYNF